MIKTTVGHFRILAPLGQGGMGAVYHAVDELSRRDVALKVLHPHLSHHPEVSRRFLNEARAAEIVDDPGVVKILEVGQLPDQTAFIAMELLAGESLSERLRRGRLGVAGALPLIHQLARTLAVAHQRQVIHRDLKPGNVMLITDTTVQGGERAKLLDFGIAKLAADVSMAGEGGTKSGMLMGTPTYMSPEQCRGARGVTAASDVYSLGVMSYEMLAGHPPFMAKGHGDLLIQHITEVPRPLQAENPLVPEELSLLVQRMLAKSATLRPGMEEVALVVGQLMVNFDATVAAAKTVSFVRMDESEQSVPPALGRTQPEPPALRSGALVQRAAIITLLVGLVGFLGGGVWFLNHQTNGGAAPLAPNAGADGARVLETAAAPTEDALPAEPAAPRPTDDGQPAEPAVTGQEVVEKPSPVEVPATGALRKTKAAQLAAQGEAKFDEGKWSDAVRLLQRAVKDAPGVSRYRLLLAEAYYKAGRYEQSITACNELLLVEHSPAVVAEAKQTLELAQRRLRTASGESH